MSRRRERAPSAPTCSPTWWGGGGLLVLWVDLEPISEHKHASDRCQGNTFKTPIALQLAAILPGSFGRRRISRPPAPSASPHLSLTRSDYKGAQTPQISDADLLRQTVDPRGIRLANHCLEPLGGSRADR